MNSEKIELFLKSKKVFIISILILVFGVLQFFVSYNIYLKIYNENMNNSLNKIFNLVKEEPQISQATDQKITKIINKDLKLINFSWLVLTNEKSDNAETRINADDMKDLLYTYPEKLNEEMKPGDYLNIEGSIHGYTSEDMPNFQISYQFNGEEPYIVMEKISRLILLISIVLYLIYIVLISGFEIKNQKGFINAKAAFIQIILAIFPFVLYFNN